MSATDELVEALRPVVVAFRELDIPHFVVGSIASSFHGAARSTMDVDVVCELTDDKIAPLVNCFDDRFYISEAAVRDAVEHRSCFNLIHLPSSIKVDVFVSRQRPFDRESLRRATPERLGESNTVEVPIATAEDTIVGKLEWYRLTDETSERQWDDVCRMLRLLGDAVDIGYLTRAAESVGVGDLLTRLLQQ